MPRSLEQNFSTVRPNVCHTLHAPQTRLTIKLAARERLIASLSSTPRRRPKKRQNSSSLKTRTIVFIRHDPSRLPLCTRASERARTAKRGEDILTVFIFQHSGKRPKLGSERSRISFSRRSVGLDEQDFDFLCFCAANIPAMR